MMTLTLTLPIVPGKAEAQRRFVQELTGASQATYAAALQRLAIAHLEFVTISTRVGDAVQLTIHAPELGTSLDMLAASHHSFDQWFKAQLYEIHGLRLASAPYIEKGGRPDCDI